ncbi:PREDICTED: myb family transcription factor EFM [Tarenaya hassleriana]|uniref:myb family transcription factor EFM n=1 Tax=Tarenaya hassleriana TaxID=28532 RepID=UPI00053C4EBC|nr:PREDICTED: myb family transcription factor EFM [Tarenaya hassleriana]
MDYAQKMQKCHEYVEALEGEQKKIQVFQRELPLCLELVTQAIEACRRELSGSSASEYVNGQSDCSEQTTSECGGHLFEEFIPIKRRSSCEEDGEHESRKSENDGDEKMAKSSGNDITDKKKSDWLRSVQLWNQSPDPRPEEDQAPKMATVVEVKRNGGAFQPFQKDKPSPKSNPSPTPALTTSSSTAETGAGKRDAEKLEQQKRKQRRCWSPELHRRFLNALQQLGGSYVATPKQIRELMKVDGLTNDEVKSHLQKYRLHTRRPVTPAAHGGGNPQPPQFVVVGGLWVPPPPPVDGTNGMYVAAQPPERISPSLKRSEDRIGGRCNSPATPSSTDTTTTSSPVA